MNAITKRFVALPRWTRAAAIYAAASTAVFLFVWHQFNARLDNPEFSGSGRQLGFVIGISLAIFFVAILSDLLVTRKIKAMNRLMGAFLVGLFSTLTPMTASADGAPKVELRKVLIKISYDKFGKADLTNVESQLPKELSPGDKTYLVKKVAEMVTATSLKPGQAIVVGPDSASVTTDQITEAMTAAQAAINQALNEATAAAEATWSNGPHQNLLGLILLIIAIALIAAVIYLIYIWAKYLIPNRAKLDSGGYDTKSLTSGGLYSGAYSGLPGVMLSSSTTGSGSGGITLEATPALGTPFDTLFSLSFKATGGGTNTITGTLTVSPTGQEPMAFDVTVPIISEKDGSALTPQVVLIDTNAPPAQFYRLKQ